MGRVSDRAPHHTRAQPHNSPRSSLPLQANQSQDIIDAKLDKRRKGVYGPPMGKRAVIFVDDLNMPQLEVYGAQPPIELLRQWMDHGGWYDLKECAFRELVDLQFVAAMGPPGGGRNPVTPRYLRHYNVCWLTDHGPASLERIFGTILKWHLEPFSAEVKSLTKDIVLCTTRIYQAISVEMLPTPAKSHYTFNLRDMSKVFQGVLQSTPKSVTSANELLRLWCHECMRVFADRLVNADDKGWFWTLLCKQLRETFAKEWDVVTGTSEDRLIYGDFMRDDTTDYLPIEKIEPLIERMTTQLDDYNAVSVRCPPARPRRRAPPLLPLTATPALITEGGPHPMPHIPALQPRI